MIRYIAIPGTHGSRRVGDWDSESSMFNTFLRKHGCELLVVSPLKRYMWSTMIDGVDGSNDTWDAAGRSLAHYIWPPLSDTPLLAPEHTYIIAHSHAGNVVAYACGKYGMKIEGLITVGTPIRKDLYDLYEAAAPNIKRHLHLYAGWKDFMQVLGSLFDGRFGIHRKHPFAKNDKMREGHGNILREEKYFEDWIKRGWLDYFKGVVPVEKPAPN